MQVRETISERATLFKLKRHEVAARTKAKAIIRKVVDSSSWLAPLMKEYRKPAAGRVDDEWITLEEKVCLLQREDRRRQDVLDQLTDKLQVLVAFMDYDRESLRNLVQAGRYVAVSSGRTLLKTGQEPLAFYLVVSGRARVLAGDTQPLAYQLLADVKKIGKTQREPLPQIKENEKFKYAQDLLGEKEVFSGEKRTCTVIPEGIIELICFEREDCLRILGPTTLKRWETIREHLQNYKIFQYLDKHTMDELVKFGNYISIPPKTTMTLKFTPDKEPEETYFMIEGVCEVVQRLLVVRDDKKKAFDRFKLYYWQEQKFFPSWVEPVYMRACVLRGGAYFGLGERLCRQHMITVSECVFLTLPYCLISYLKDRLPTYGEALLLLDTVFPSTVDLFLTYVWRRFWKDYVKKVVKDCKKRPSVDNNVHDVPVLWRADRLKIRHPWQAVLDGHPDSREVSEIEQIEAAIEDRRRRRAELTHFREQAFSQYRTLYRNS